MKLLDAIKNAKRVYICGNGGSAANSIHIANDLISVGIKAHAIVDISTITAIGNDFGYDEVFSRQIDVYGEPGDLLLCLTGSGNSPNILRALDIANNKGMDTWVITGGGKAQFVAKNKILTDPLMQPSEEQQISIGHEIMLELRDEI